MQKIKYIIIFTLLLGLGLLYMQINDYDKISSSLLEENKDSIIQINQLKDHISQLENQNQELQDKLEILQDQIITLEEKVTISTMKIDDGNFTIPTDIQIPEDINNTNLEQNQTNPLEDSSIKPNVTVDDENKVTGFDIQYEEKF